MTCQRSRGASGGWGGESRPNRGAQSPPCSPPSRLPGAFWEVSAEGREVYCMTGLSEALARLQPSVRFQRSLPRELPSLAATSPARGQARGQLARGCGQQPLSPLAPGPQPPGLPGRLGAGRPQSLGPRPDPPSWISEAGRLSRKWEEPREKKRQPFSPSCLGFMPLTQHLRRKVFV